MPKALRASVIITNYNYGRFLNDAVDSALGQTHPDTEVIVVDDGSADDSPRIIAGYGERIIPVLKSHGGQASAFNAGVRVSRGQVVCFLDSDDVLLPTAIQQAVEALEDPRVSRVHWPLWAIDAHGRKTGVVVPSGQVLAEGDLRDVVLQKGPVGYTWSPTTGNAWARRFIERVFPMPEQEWVTCADTYLALVAPFEGLLRKLPTPQALYRDHGSNNRLRICHRFVTSVRAGPASSAITGQGNLTDAVRAAEGPARRRIFQLGGEGATEGEPAPIPDRDRPAVDDRSLQLTADPLAHERLQIFGSEHLDQRPLLVTALGRRSLRPAVALPRPGPAAQEDPVATVADVGIRPDLV